MEEKTGYYRRRYEERKRAGLCVGCRNKAMGGKVYCVECEIKNVERARQNRAFYREQGICHACGKNRVFRNEGRCPECRAREAEYQARKVITDEMRDKINARERRLYAERSGQGICVRCGKRKSETGKRSCGICGKKRASRARERYAAIRSMSGTIPRSERYQRQLCYTCGRDLDMQGVKICTSCYMLMKKTRAKGHNQFWEQDNAILFRKKEGSSCDTVTEKAKEIFRAAPYADAFQQQR